MSAAVRAEDFLDVQKLLYQWGDECRSKADELGLPQSSGLKRLIEQRHVIDKQRRDLRKRKRRVKPDERIQLRQGVVAIECACGMIRFDGECPRCAGDPREPDRSVHAVATRSFKPVSITSVSAEAVRIDVIVAASPGWMRKVLMLSYLWLQRDSVACQRLRIRQSTYREQREAAVEYVAQRLAIC